FSFLSSFSFYSHLAHRDLHSFPTRRSSDLRALPARVRSARARLLVPAHTFHQRLAVVPDRPRGNLWPGAVGADIPHSERGGREGDRKSTRLNSSHVKISYAVFCLKKKKKKK